MASESGQLRPIDPDGVERARRAVIQLRPHVVGVLRALCEPRRFQIVQALRAGELPVRDLAAVIGHAEPATSQHLRVLRQVDLVAQRREHRVVYYRLQDGPPALLALSILALAERDSDGAGGAQAPTSPG